MAEILASIKILPAEAGINLDHIKEEIKNSLPEEVKLYKMVEDPIAFGLVALIIHVILPEENPKIMDNLEDALKSIKDIGETQVIGMSRIG
ncbi:MAG: elongation factor 1-beta [Candidatus Bathyarchaeia archaeon]